MTEPISGPAYRILTPRLCLRCWEPQDAPALKAAVDASREYLKPWMPWAHVDTSLEMHLKRLRGERAKFDLDQDFTYAILSRDGSQVLGSTGLHTRLGAKAREIGYWVHVDHIGRGYASEAAMALTQVAFRVEGMDRVEIHCAPDNAASAAIPRKLGYTHETTLRRRLHWPDGTVMDSMVWTLFAADFPDSPSARLEIQAFDAIGREIALQG
ncbi:MAG: GNAT family N-acetyltransferase [Anaerolineales bacterium]